MTIILANWKMKLGLASSERLLEQLREKLSALERAEVWIAPSFTALERIIRNYPFPHVKYGAQNVHWLGEGAWTGEISPIMLSELAASFAIVGHSERRYGLGESDALVARRAAGALAHSLIPVVCIGETLKEYEDGSRVPRLREQIHALLELLPPPRLNQVVLAYEPVWSIGTGRTPLLQEIGEVHEFLGHGMAFSNWRLSESHSLRWKRRS